MASNFLLAICYELAWILFFAGITQRLGRDRDLNKEFDGYFFLKWSFGLAFVAQAGFVPLVSILFYQHQALAIALTALVAMPGWLLLSGWMQWSFFRRYQRLPNIIKRLERLNAQERLELLESLPPKIYNQLPGDYRFISRHSEPGSRP